MYMYIQIYSYMYILYYTTAAVAFPRARSSTQVISLDHNSYVYRLDRQKILVDEGDETDESDEGDEGEYSDSDKENEDEYEQQNQQQSLATLSQAQCIS